LNTTRRYRILLLAEAANPEWTSSPLIGWSLYRALAKVVDVHLVTQIRNRSAIIRAGLCEGRDFTCIDNENLARPLARLAEKVRGGAGKGWTINTAFSSLAYYSFELSVWRCFKSRLTARAFDLAHRVTPLNPTHQSLIASRLANINVPFIMGPLNGGVPWLKQFTDRKHAEGEWLADLRWLHKLMPGYRSTLLHSTAIIVGSKFTYSDMPEWAKNKCVYIPENGVDLDRFNMLRTRHASLPIRGAFVGRLVPCKGADILLEAAAAHLRTGKLSLKLIGDGPQRQELEKLVDRLGIRKHVHFYGWVRHNQVQNILSECDFMALPSIREFGGGVILEAMALGVTPIVADYGGPSELVDDTTGVRVKFTDEQSLVDGLRLTLSKIIHSPDMLDTLGTAARNKIMRKLTWGAKANQIAAIYDAVLTRKDDFQSLDYT
jgi:glycosyltransferase involved in cell wall biosynthesis